MAQKLKGKAAVVTGGGGGIGRAVALGLAEEGAQVVVNDIGKDENGKSLADKVVAEIKKANGTAVANYNSVDTMKDGAEIIKTATSNFGRLDILVNCAGNFKVAGIKDVTEEIWDSIIAVHLKGHFSCSKAAIPEMLKQKSGRIINISSRAATFGKGSIAYGTAKAGIIGFTSMLSSEMKDQGITVNALLPSAQTQLFPNTPPAFGDNVPVPTARGPEYIAPLIVYLATDEAKDITGQYFYAGGGDVAVYARPFQLSGAASILLRKPGKWTVDELKEVLPQVIKQG